VGEPRLAQRGGEAHADVVEVRAAIESLAVGVDRLAQLSGLAVRVAERGLEVRQLSAGGRVESARARSRVRAGPLGDLAGRSKSPWRS
jgi:hypothetical protein